MTQSPKTKIQAIVAAFEARESGHTEPSAPVRTASPTQIDQVVDRILRGERTYSLNEVSKITGQSYHVLHRNLRGKLGLLQATEGGGIRLTETLAREYLRQMTAKGPAAADAA